MIHGACRLKTWSADQKEVSINLSDRIIMSPYAAKRLAMLINNVVVEYEKRWGSLDVGRPEPGGKA